ncbi:hypothetical protein AABB24_001184 [Solanum stoloniferum]|uniref:Uncharacterized protein n=1 Tax=Solanum stoloniferum TaxID=62892 RepID=A0ABD2VJD5_9SOLN
MIEAHPFNVLLSRYAIVLGVFQWFSSLRRSRVRPFVGSRLPTPMSDEGLGFLFCFRVSLFIVGGFDPSFAYRREAEFKHTQNSQESYEHLWSVARTLSFPLQKGGPHGRWGGGASL